MEIRPADSQTIDKRDYRFKSTVSNKGRKSLDKDKYENSVGRILKKAAYETPTNYRPVQRTEMNTTRPTAPTYDNPRQTGMDMMAQFRVHENRYPMPTTSRAPAGYDPDLWRSFQLIRRGYSNPQHEQIRLGLMDWGKSISK
jgi:hypothetical protein